MYHVFEFVALVLTLVPVVWLFVDLCLPVVTCFGFVRCRNCCFLRLRVCAYCSVLITLLLLVILGFGYFWFSVLNCVCEFGCGGC